MYGLFKSYFLLTYSVFFSLFIQSCRDNDTAYHEALGNCETSKVAPVTSSIRIMMDKTCLNGVRLTTFEATDLDGRVINNKSLKGKYFLLNFWFIECPPCIEELPLLNKIHSDYSDKIELISLCRNSISDIESFLATNKIDFTIIPDGRTLLENVFKNPFGYPLTYLVNEKGVIIHLYFSLQEGTPEYADLIERIEAI